MLKWEKDLKSKEIRIANQILSDATYELKRFNQIHKCVGWGEDTHHFTSIDGSTAELAALKAGIAITGKLLAECKYIFKWSRDHSKLIPARVSMHPRTVSNIMRGSNRYGVGHIMMEIRTQN